MQHKHVKGKQLQQTSLKKKFQDLTINPEGTQKGSNTEGQKTRSRNLIF
jgi:hypothetical protein